MERHAHVQPSDWIFRQFTALQAVMNIRDVPICIRATDFCFANGYSARVAERTVYEEAPDVGHRVFDIGLLGNLDQLVDGGDLVKLDVVLHNTSQPGWFGGGIRYNLFTLAVRHSLRNTKSKLLH